MSAHYWLTRWGLEIAGRAMFGLRTEGREWIPRSGAVLIASNHRSALDPVVVGTAARREIHYLAKEELFRGPLVSCILRAYNAFPVRRGAADRHALRRVLQLLRAGEAVLLFPEGTRNRAGGFLPARPGAGMLAAKAGVPVVPALVQGTDRILSQCVRRNLSVRFGQPLTVHQGAREPDPVRAEYRALAGRIMDAVAKLGYPGVEPVEQSQQEGETGHARRA